MILYSGEFNTEGVMILVSANALKAHFSRVEFDYTFPKGILPLVLNKNLFALITDESVDKLTISNDNAELDKVRASGKWEEYAAGPYLKIQPNDKLLLLNHAEFTQICD